MDRHWLVDGAYAIGCGRVGMSVQEVGAGAGEVPDRPSGGERCRSVLNGASGRSPRSFRNVPAVVADAGVAAREDGIVEGDEVSSDTQIAAVR